MVNEKIQEEQNQHRLGNGRSWKRANGKEDNRTEVDLFIPIVHVIFVCVQ